jgi:hypothetical protein
MRRAIYYYLKYEGVLVFKYRTGQHIINYANPLCISGISVIMALTATAVYGTNAEREIIMMPPFDQ